MVGVRASLGLDLGLDLGMGQRIGLGLVAEKNAERPAGDCPYVWLGSN